VDNLPPGEDAFKFQFPKNQGVLSRFLKKGSEFELQKAVDSIP